MIRLQLLHCINLPHDFCNNLHQCQFILMNAFVRYNDKIYLHRLSHVVTGYIEDKRADFYKAFFIIDRTRR